MQIIFSVPHLIQIYNTYIGALEQDVQRGCECPLHRGVQGQAGWGCEQPGLERGVPAYWREVGTR